jgi:hypothetical protein
VALTHRIRRRPCRGPSALPLRGGADRDRHSDECRPLPVPLDVGTHTRLASELASRLQFGMFAPLSGKSRAKLKQDADLRRAIVRTQSAPHPTPCPRTRSHTLIHTCTRACAHPHPHKHAHACTHNHKNTRLRADPASHMGLHPVMQHG